MEHVLTYCATLLMAGFIGWYFSGFAMTIWLFIAIFLLDKQG